VRQIVPRPAPTKPLGQLIELINVSFFVAVFLLILSLIYRRRELRGAEVE
jgi:hypothetical protein